MHIPGATQDRKLFRRHGQIMGENCRSLGFNVDFAPVLDLAFEASRGVMESRAVSPNPHETIAYAREFLAGLRAGTNPGVSPRTKWDFDAPSPHGAAEVGEVLERHSRLCSEMCALEGHIRKFL